MKVFLLELIIIFGTKVKRHHAFLTMPAKQQVRVIPKTTLATTRRRGATAAEATLNDAAEKDTLVQASGEQAVQSVKSCIKMALFSVLADTATLVPSLPQLLAPPRIDVPVQVLDALFTAWKVFLVMHMRRVVQRLAPDGVKSLDQTFWSTSEEQTDSFRLMANFWRVATLFLTGISLAEMGMLYRNSHARGKLTFLVALPVFLGMLITWILQKTQTQDVSSLVQPSAESEATALVGHARWTIQNMALCVGAIILRAGFIPLRACQIPNLGGKILELTHLPIPTGLAILLLQLRRALWTVAVELQNRTTVGTESKRALFSAQTAFWGKLGSVFQTEAWLKILALVATKLVLPHFKK